MDLKGDIVIILINNFINLQWYYPGLILDAYAFDSELIDMLNGSCYSFCSKLFIGFSY